MNRIVIITIGLFLSIYLDTRAQKSYEPYYDNPSSHHAKEMLKLFENIAQEKWDNAYKKMEDIRKDYQKEKQKHPERAEELMEALRPLPDLADALFEMAPPSEKVDRPVMNIWSAYERIKKVESDMYRVNAFLALIKDSPLKLGNIIEDLENRLHRETQTKKSVEAYSKLIGTLRSNSLIKETVEHEYEQVVFEQVMKDKDIEKCNAYLKRFMPIASNTNVEEVIKLRNKLAYDAAPATTQGMEQFLATYPRAEQVGAARHRLYEYAFLDLARTAQTEEAYNDYLQKYPDSPFCDAVKDSMCVIGWRKAEANNTLDAYDLFRKMYPNSQQAVIAQRRELVAARQELICETPTEESEALKAMRERIGKIPDFILNDTILRNHRMHLLYGIYSALAFGVHSKEVESIEEITYLPTGDTYKKTYTFYESGLIKQESHSQHGITIYTYDLESGMGIYLKSRSESRGKSLTYTPQFSPDGMLEELIASDGSKESFIYDEEEGYESFIRACYNKGSKNPFLKETYQHGQMVETVKADSHTVCEVNHHGDITKMQKYNSGSVVAMTRIEYDYNDKGCWIEYRQYSASNQLLVRKTREYTYREIDINDNLRLESSRR